MRHCNFVLHDQRTFHYNFRNGIMFTYIVNKFISCTPIQRKLEWYVSCSAPRSKVATIPELVPVKAISFLCLTYASHKFMTNVFPVLPDASKIWYFFFLWVTGSIIVGLVKVSERFHLWIWSANQYHMMSLAKLLWISYSLHFKWLSGNPNLQIYTPPTINHVVFTNNQRRVIFLC